MLLWSGPEGVRRPLRPDNSPSPHRSSSASICCERMKEKQSKSAKVAITPLAAEISPLHSELLPGGPAFDLNGGKSADVDRPSCVCVSPCQPLLAEKIPKTWWCFTELQVAGRNEGIARRIRTPTTRASRSSPQFLGSGKTIFDSSSLRGRVEKRAR